MYAAREIPYIDMFRYSDNFLECHLYLPITSSWVHMMYVYPVTLDKLLAGLPQVA